MGREERGCQQAVLGVTPHNAVGGWGEECCTGTSRRSLVQITPVWTGEGSCRAVTDLTGLPFE